MMFRREDSKEGLVERLAGVMMAMYCTSDIRIDRDKVKESLRKHTKEVLQETLDTLEGRNA